MVALEASAPARDEREVTLLGPGYGESVVVHLGGAKWMIVDSCINRSTRRPAALTYLDSIGVSPEAVVAVVASHWHDDHIRGLAEIVSECAGAEFICSSALATREFLQLVSTDGLSQTRLTSGVAEFRKVLDVVTGRDPAVASRTPKFAAADMILWEGSNEASGTRVVALTPSSAAQLSASQTIARLVPSVTSKRVRIPDLRPNDYSVAAMLDHASHGALLGADLETTSAPDTGWNGVFGNSVSVSPASLYKVAHHGSETGHHDQIFTDLMAPMGVCVLTPFRRGKVSLPLEDDVSRIVARSGGELYSTALGRGRDAPRDAAVTRTLRDMGATVEKIDPVMGTVQLRRRPDEKEWRIGLSESAGRLG